MAYTAPTLSDFRTRYPVFASVADATTQVWLDEGDTEAAGFPEDVRARAVMLYAAHNLAMQGQGVAAMPVGATSFKSGTFSASVSDRVATRTGFYATTYGQDYLALARRDLGTPRLAWEPPSA